MFLVEVQNRLLYHFHIQIPGIFLCVLRLACEYPSLPLDDLFAQFLDPFLDKAFMQTRVGTLSLAQIPARGAEFIHPHGLKHFRCIGKGVVTGKAICVGLV